MTDKQIIIDGVNVLECEHYEYKSLKDCEMRYPESGDCEIGLINYLFNGNLDMEKLCVDNPNCYYKQLARKTQECESLKQEIEILQNNFDTATRDCNDEIEILKQECEELKIYIESNEQQVKEVETLVMDNDRLINELDQLKAENENWQKEYWKLEQGNDFLAEKNSRLKGCLAEIKEIAEPFCNACQEFEPEKKGSNCMYCNYGIILRKISEMEK